MPKKTAEKETINKEKKLIIKFKKNIFDLENEASQV